MTASERIRAAQVSVHRANLYSASATISPAVTMTALSTARRTTYLNIKLDRGLNEIFGKTYTKNQRIAQVLNRINPGYRDDGLSQSAINGAWKAEKLEIELGGKGTVKWTKAQRKELLETGRVKGYEGHHQQSVKYHSEEQANPDNIKLYSHKDHLKEGHHGDYKNESDAPMYDRRQRLIRTKRKSVIKNELLGGTIVAVVSFITSAGLRFVIEMVKSNRNPEDVKKAGILAVREGAEAAGYALISYGLARVSVLGVKKVFEIKGIKLASNAMKWVEGGIAAVAIAIAVGVITYIKLRINGYGRKDAFKEAGKVAIGGLAIGMISLIISINFGTAWAIGFNVVVAVGSLFFILYEVVHEKRLVEKLQVYTIQEMTRRCLPVAA